MSTIHYEGPAPEFTGWVDAYVCDRCREKIERVNVSPALNSVLRDFTERDVARLRLWSCFSQKWSAKFDDDFQPRWDFCEKCTPVVSDAIQSFANPVPSHATKYYDREGVLWATRLDRDQREAFLTGQAAAAAAQHTETLLALARAEVLKQPCCAWSLHACTRPVAHIEIDTRHGWCIEHTPQRHFIGSCTPWCPNWNTTPSKP